MHKKISVLLIALFVTATNASAMTITYDIGMKTIGNWSGDYFDQADGCTGGSPSDMCRGTLTGDWDGTILSNITGALSGSMGTINITGGSLGGAYYSGAPGSQTLLWSLETDSIGTLYFDDPQMNKITADALTLWTESLLAYSTAAGEGCRGRCGTHLFGENQALPEPGTIGIALLGLLSMPLMMRQRRRTAELSA